MSTLAAPPVRVWGQVRKLEPWRPGMLDIHHLAYGRGNSTFVLCPDGTTLLIDAGTTEDSLDVSCAQKPNARLRPGQWIAEYILRQMAPAGRRELDTFVLTHIHPDHLGDVVPANPKSAKGDYRLTGLMDVAEGVKIGRVIDRAYPNYSYPAPLQGAYAANYLAYIKSRAQGGGAIERVKVGSKSQIGLTEHPSAYPSFSVRNLSANGEVWTGPGDQTRQTFPDLKTLPSTDYPSENLCSIALRMSYGKFDYFTGGDLTSDIEETQQPWRDIETAAARAAGPVEVAVANHHAYFDAVGPEFVRALRPRVFIVPSWYVAHASILPLRRMLSQKLYPGDRDVFATCMMDAAKQVDRQFVGQVKSTDGHILVRVAPGGGEFRVIVTDNNDDEDRVKAQFGPWTCS